MREPLRHTQEFTKTVLDNWKDIESMAAALPEKVDIQITASLLMPDLPPIVILKYVSRAPDDGSMRPNFSRRLSEREVEAGRTRVPVVVSFR